MTSPITAPCPRCGVDLDLHGDVALLDFLPAEDDSEGKVRAQLILDCNVCEANFSAFVALSDFALIAEGGT